MNTNSFKLIFIGLLFAVYSAAASAADLSSTFNMPDLAHSYALSCAEQAEMRHGNILPPYFKGRPAAFENQGEGLVIYSPFLTGPDRARAQALFESVPKYVLPLAWRGGAVYVFTRRGLVEAVPALAVETDWFQDYGLYMEVERRLYVPAEKGEGMKRRADGTYVARRWTPTRRDLLRVINHESGHMVDEMLGVYSLNSRGEDGEYRLSNRPDFIAAVEADLARLASNDRPISLAQARKLGYYMPRAFKGLRLGIQTDQRARRETFAELWAEAHGYDKNHLSRAYPETFRLVKEIAAFLKAQDAAAAVKCF